MHAVPKESTKDLSPGFLRSMYELHIVMKNVNNNMKPKEDEVVSKPWHWPILYKGQHFTAWGDDDQKIFLMGNPVIWYGNLVAIGVFGIAYLVIALMTQRGYENVLFKSMWWSAIRG
jgi:dolichyl-phosphate-mannose-protein mannosyltransferase